MKNRRIVAKFLAVTMFLAAFAYWPARELSANTFITVTAGGNTTQQMLVTPPAGHTVDAVSGGGTSGGITLTASLGVEVVAGAARPVNLSVFAHSETAGETVTRTLWFAFSDNTFEERTVTITVEATPTPTPSPQTPVIQMTQPNTYITMEAGIPRVVDITLRNTSNFNASRFQIMPRANANFRVEVVGDLPAFTLHGNSQRTFQLLVTPHATLETGVHNVVFDFSFENNLRTVMTRDATLVVRVEQSADRVPRVLMTNFVTSPVIPEAGEDFSLTVTLRNTSGVSANNIQLSLGQLAAGGFSARGTTSNFVGSLGANSTRDVSFNLTAGANMATGSHPVSLTLRHDGPPGGDVRTETFVFFVTVLGEEDEDEEDVGRARLTILSINRPYGIFEVGEEAQISVTIHNQGDEDAANVRITARPETGVVPRLASIQTLSRLHVGQSHTFNFAFAPTSAAESRFYNIGFEVSFESDVERNEDGSRERESFEQFTGFIVYNPEEEEDDDDDDDGPRSVPRIIISSYTVQPLMVMANSEFDLSLTMMNTHRERSIGNIRVTWEVIGVAAGNEITGGATFTPVDSSNTFFVDYIPPRGTVEHHMRLFAIPDAAPRSHTITVSFEYEDMEANPFESTENIGINVRQVSLIELSPIMLQDMASIGSPVNLSFSVFNTGRTTVRNLRVRAEGEGIDGSGADQFFGSMPAGGVEWFWGTFFPIAPGPTTVYVITSFEDEMGERHEIVQEFFMSIMEDFGGGMGGGMGEWGGDDWWGGEFEEEGNGGLFGLPGIFGATWLWATGGGLILAGGGTTLGVVLRKRRKRQRSGFGFGDDDDF